MIWALLAILGIPIWLVVGMLVTALIQRRRIATTPGVFRYKLRTDKGWSRPTNHARWVSDVVIRYQGVALVRSHVDQVSRAEVIGPVEDTVRGIGDDVVEIGWTMPGHDPVHIAVSRDVVSLALGGQHASAGHTESDARV